MTALYKYFASFLLIISMFAYNAAASEPKPEEEKLDVNSMIMHHIKDSHSWHILTYQKDGEEKQVSIPLPVILYYNGHLDVFMSSEFHHGEENVIRGDREYILHHEKIYLANDEHGITLEEGEKEGEHVIANEKPLDFSLTRNAAALLFSVFLLLWIFLSMARAYKKRPGRPAGLQAFLEPLVLFVRDDIVIPNVGKHKYEKYLPYLLTLFFFLLINNILGLIPFFPGGSNVTGNIAITFTLALLTLLITVFSGNKNYWRHIFAAPGVPWWLYIVMIPVELIGVISKPFALMIRLFANITAGHIIVLSLVSLIFIFQSLWIAPVSIIFVLFMDILELLVAFLQAYIFTLLTALFIGMAVEEHH